MNCAKNRVILAAVYKDNGRCAQAYARGNKKGPRIERNHIFIDRNTSLNLISFLQHEVILQHEIHQLNEYDLIVDAVKTTFENSLIGRWISISWHRQTETLDFFAFDVVMVTDVEIGKVFADYKDEGVHAVPLKASRWNCSTNDIPRRQHRWCMLAKKYIKTEATHESMSI